SSPGRSFGDDELELGAARVRVAHETVEAVHEQPNGVTRLDAVHPVVLNSRGERLLAARVDGDARERELTGDHGEGVGELGHLRVPPGFTRVERTPRAAVHVL